MTYEEIKKELAKLDEEPCTTYELYCPSDGSAPYYTDVFDSKKYGAILDKKNKLWRLPEYIEGKAKDKLRAKAESYRRQLKEINETKAYIEEWLAEYEAKERR